MPLDGHLCHTSGVFSHYLRNHERVKIFIHLGTEMEYMFRMVAAHIHESYCFYCPHLERLNTQAPQIPTPPIPRPLPSGTLLVVHLLSENPGCLLVPSLPDYFLFFLSFFFFYILKHFKNS